MFSVKTNIELNPDPVWKYESKGESVGKEGQQAGGKGAVWGLLNEGQFSLQAGYKSIVYEGITV